MLRNHLKNIMAFGLCTALIAVPALASDARPLGNLYTADLIDAQFAEALADGISANPPTLPETMPYNADMVNVENVAADGTDVYVAILDTGLVDLWPFFFSQATIRDDLGIGFSHDASWDPILEDVVLGPLKNDRGFITHDYGSGHGTHVTSTVAGFNINDTEWVRGIAPNVSIIPVLVLDAWIVDTGSGLTGFTGGTDEMVSAGIRYVADLTQRPMVINMSLGGDEPSPMIEEAVDYAISQGVIVVASAGNNGTAGMGYPGGYPQIISTAAGGWSSMTDQLLSWRDDVPEKLNSNDILGNNTQTFLEDFSSRPVKELGQKHQDLDVAGPGSAVVGPYQCAFYGCPLSYWYLSGTSMAAPHVSAIAALTLQDSPLMEHEAMEFHLKKAARGNPFPADDAVIAWFGNYFLIEWDGGDAGAGLLQADAAAE